MVDAVRAMGHGLVVVVDGNCGRWCALQGVSGFVSGAESTFQSTATAVAISLATLSAPETLACLDHEDAECVSGARRGLICWWKGSGSGAGKSWSS